MADDIFHLGNAVGGPLGTAAPKQTIVIPSSESDIVIRTMASDLASLAASGGNGVQVQPLSFDAHVSISESTAIATDTGTVASAPARSRIPLVVVMALVGVLILGVGGYIAWDFWGRSYFAPSVSPEALVSAPAASSSAPLTSPSLAPAVGVYDFTHSSFLKKPADQAFALVLGGSANSASDLQTYSQKVSNALTGLKPDTTFIEMRVVDQGGKPLSFGQFLYAVSANLVDQNTLANNFLPDFTFFIYKDGNGYWPGFVLQLQPSKNWLFLKDEMTRVEKATARDSVFLTQPGTPSGSGFVVDAVGELPVRSLNYSNPSASFLYGWLRNYFIISTSRDGMREVLNRL